MTNLYENKENFPDIKLVDYINEAYNRHEENLCGYDRDYQLGIVDGYNELESLLYDYFEDCTPYQIGELMHEYLFEEKDKDN